MIAAASMDDVLAISCFTILLGITFHGTGDQDGADDKEGVETISSREVS